MPSSGNAPASEQPPPEESGEPGGTLAFPVVGIGASAGGLEAVSELLRALPADTGMAFVIVQHLAPDRASGLPGIFARTTTMKVCEVSESCGELAVEPDHVYVIPPGQALTIEQGHLRLCPQQPETRRRGIDVFFSSLAKECGYKAVGVVLSGALNDGTVGLEAIRAEGGITFAQNDSALHESMPRSAVASGSVDFVLSPKEIAGEISRISRHPLVRPVPEPEAEIAEDAGHARVAEIMHRATGVDFTHYKANTLRRRIARRMVLHKLETMREYEAYLLDTPGEMEVLLQEILIGVTSFFRDSEAYATLTRTVFPKLLAGRSRQEPLRIWTLGCSTGQEAYSLAIAFTECAENLESTVSLQIFATDLNHRAIDTARAGLYPKSIAEEMSPERLRRYFTEEDEGYRICKAIRERCIFSRHNVLADPPFSRVDLISCRNMLIYLEPVLQQQVVPMLHYALKQRGYLWLGTSESVGTGRALFDVEDARHKIFAKRPGGSHPGMRFHLASGMGAPGQPSTPPPAPYEPARVDLPKEAERLLLSKYAPPGILVSATMEILQYRGDTSPYLAPVAGAASLHLLKMLREDLLVGVRAAFVRAAETGRAVREEGLRVGTETGYRELAVEVLPVHSRTQDRGFLVLFLETQRVRQEAVAEQPGTREAALHRDEMGRLTHELAATRDYLQSVIEQQEAVNEELQSANEEAQSANEELQSINEELETSKEEIQSTNEELITVNEQLGLQGAELNRVNATLLHARDYAQSIVSSVRWPLVVLDGGLRVRSASSAFYTTFQVDRSATEGRSIYELGNHQWDIPALRKLLENILPQAQLIDDFEVTHHFERIGLRTMMLSGRCLMQSADREPLIVLAIEDVTERKRTGNAQNRLAAIVESTDDAIISKDLNGIITTWNAGARRLFGYTAEEAIGQPVTIFIPADRIAEETTILGHIRRGEAVEHFETIRRHKNGTLVNVSLTISPLRNHEGKIVGASKIAHDITGRKRAEEALREKTEQLTRADRSKDEFLAMLAHELRNPLAPMRNAVEILEETEALAEDHASARNVLRRQIGNMSRMIDDLMDVSRITNGKIDLRLQPVALETVLTAAASLARSDCGNHEQMLELSLPAQPVFLNADATRLEQVFGNLLTNACKYSGKGSRIALRAERDEAAATPQVIIRVCDNGHGIAPDLLPHVFELFKQSSRSLDRAQGGLGIGLTLVRRLVELHGGTVAARSDGLGHGSEFVVRLPILAGAPGADTSAHPAATREKAARILIVDDNTDAAKTLGMLQKRRGHDTRIAFTGTEALVIAAEFLPEVVLLDIGLPGMDGFEVARQIRAMPALAGTFVVAMSGYGRGEDIAEARTAGFDNYLVKPVSLTKLNELLHTREQLRG